MGCVLILRYWDPAPAQRWFRDRQEGETWLLWAPVHRLRPRTRAGSQARNQGLSSPQWDCRRMGTPGSQRAHHGTARLQW